jgi:DNA-binding NarL/FixJ family response regulator
MWHSRLFDGRWQKTPHFGRRHMAKILVADDNADIRRALCEQLKRETDFEVCGEARDGQDSIQKAQQLHPDLIVLDLSMPVMNGLEAARVLKHLMPSVPIIMFTLYFDPFIENETRSASVAYVVSKSEHISVLTDKERGLLYRNAA